MWEKLKTKREKEKTYVGYSTITSSFTTVTLANTSIQPSGVHFFFFFFKQLNWPLTNWRKWTWIQHSNENNAKEIRNFKQNRIISIHLNVQKCQYSWNRNRLPIAMIKLNSKRARENEVNEWFDLIIMTTYRSTTRFPSRVCESSIDTGKKIISFRL